MSNILATTFDDGHAVTQSDTTPDPAGPFAGLLVTAAGTVTIATARGRVLALGTLPAGTLIPIATSRVDDTGSSATVVGLYAYPYAGKG